MPKRNRTKPATKKKSTAKAKTVCDYKEIHGGKYEWRCVLAPDEHPHPGSHYMKPFKMIVA